MNINNLSEQAKKAAEAAKAAGISSVSSAKEALSEGLESLKDKVAGDKANVSDGTKDKISDLLHKGADALEGLANKIGK